MQNDEKFALNSWRWRNIDFLRVGTIDPKRDHQGSILLHAPQPRYVKRDTAKLNNYGAGPFCAFRLPGLPHASGVYVYVIAGQPMYVGRAADLYARYGHISPKNCYRGGRETNCRMNTLIYNAYVTGKAIDVYTCHAGLRESGSCDDLRPAAKMEP